MARKEKTIDLRLNNPFDINMLVIKMITNDKFIDRVMENRVMKIYPNQMVRTEKW